MFPTDKEVAKIVREMGCTINKQNGEYRVNIKGDPAINAYFTTDRLDALHTAGLMIEARRING